MKKIYMIIILVLMSFSLCSCRWINESREMLRDTTEDFLSYIAVGDYQIASSLLHPDSIPSSSNLSFYIMNLENRHDIDFSEEVVIKKAVDFSYVAYTSEFGGGTYETTYEINIGGKPKKFYIFILDNKIGKGIYRFDIEV